MLAGILFYSCDNDDYPHSAVPSIILNEFGIQFPSATDVEFTEVGKNYIVDFEMKGKDAGAVIAPSGTILKVKQEISFEQLPVEIQDALFKYGAGKTENPEVVKTIDEVYYQAQVKRLWFDKKVVLDNTGKENTSFSYWD